MMAFVFINKISRSSFCFIEDFGNIFAKNTNSNELDSTKKEHNSHDGWIALDGVPPY